MVQFCGFLTEYCLEDKDCCQDGSPLYQALNLMVVTEPEAE